MVPRNNNAVLRGWIFKRRRAKSKSTLPPVLSKTRELCDASSVEGLQKAMTHLFVESTTIRFWPEFAP